VSLPARLYLLVITVLLLAALMICIPVIVNIVREGLDRREQWRADEIELYSPDPKFEAGPPAVLDEETPDLPPGMVACPYCGATNESGFAYCGRCVSPI